MKTVINSVSSALDVPVLSALDKLLYHVISLKLCDFDNNICGKIKG